jgi:hypothetical protein
MSLPGDAVARPRGRLAEIAAIALSVLLLFAAMLWVTSASGVIEPPGSGGSSLSAGQRGTLALYRWLERAGFQVSRVMKGERFPPDADTLLMINPNDDFPTGQAGSVKRWVEDGGTLVLAISSLSSDLSTALGGKHPMLRELGLDLSVTQDYTATALMAQPVFSRPPVAAVKVPGSYSLGVPVTSTVVLVSAARPNGARVAIGAQVGVGKGRVYILSSDYPFSNRGIREESNGALVYNIVQAVGGRRVAFDEAHHGQGAEGDLLALLTSTPWGWAIIYAALLLAAYALWRARRLGPPLPVKTPDQRRPTSDYVTAVAGLFRRARKPGYAAERYLQFFKRTLSRHAELDPYLTDRAFVESLEQRGRHPFDREEMLRAIERLRGLEGEGTAGGDGGEDATLRAMRDAEKVRRDALGEREGAAQSK